MESIKENVHVDFNNLKENKEQCFTEFYKNNYDLVKRIAFSILKDEDISQDVGQNVFEKIYKMSLEKLPTDHEASWLYTVTKNEALQYLRKNKFYLPIEEAEKSHIQNKTDEIELVEQKENYDRLVKKLNKKQYQIVSLKVESDFTFKEIGEILVMPIATVQWHYYSSIKQLKLAVSNLAMFIIALAVGLGSNKKDEKKQENKKTNKHLMDSESEVNKEDSLSQMSVNDVYTSSENARQTTSVTSNEKITSPVSIISFSFAGIFLVISIIFSIFFIKNQQKSLKKASKK